MSDVGFVFDTSVGEVNLDLRQVIVPDMLARGWVHLPNLETDAELKTFARRVFAFQIAALAMLFGWKHFRRAVRWMGKQHRWLAALILVGLYASSAWNREPDPELVVVWTYPAPSLIEKYQTLASSKTRLMMNHWYGEYHKYIKSQLLDSLKKEAEERGCDYTKIFPPTFLLTRVSECHDFAELLRREKSQLWFLKDPTRGSHGAGITVLDSLGILKQLDTLKNGELACHAIATRRELSVQRAVPPLLLRQRKFDIRVYVLIANHHPLFVYYHTGYVRLAGDEFQSNQMNHNIHVGNSDEIKGAASYNISDHYFKQEQLQELMVAEGLTKEHYRSLANKVKIVSGRAIHLMLPNLDRIPGYFLFLGVDIVVDTDLNPYFLEANINPEITLDEVRTGMNTHLGKHMLDLLVEVNSKSKMLEEEENQPTELLQTKTSWELLYTDAVQPPYHLAGIELCE